MSEEVKEAIQIVEEEFKQDRIAEISGLYRETKKAVTKKRARLKELEADLELIEKGKIKKLRKKRKDEKITLTGVGCNDFTGIEINLNEPEYKPEKEKAYSN